MKYIPACNVPKIERETVCLLPDYCQVNLIEVVEGDLSGNELLELFFTGKVLGRNTIKKLV